MNDELRGTIVLVRPDLPVDLLYRQNDIGVISEANIENDDIYVDFADRVTGLYASDALLTFLPVDQIHKNLAELHYLTDFHNLKKLTTIDLFIRYGSFEKRREAMRIARDNKSILPRCLDTLQNQIALRISQNYQR